MSTNAPKFGDVGNHAFEYHADLQVADFRGCLRRRRPSELAARVAAGFFQLGQNIQNSRQAKAFVDEVGRFDLLHALAVANEFGGGNALLRQHFGDDRIGFGVDGARIQRLFAAINPQKARRLLEGFFAQTRHFQQFFAAVERTVFIAVGNDVLGKGLDSNRKSAPRAGRKRYSRPRRRRFTQSSTTASSDLAS